MYHFRIVRVQLEDETEDAALPPDWEPFHAEASTVSGGGWVVYLRQDDEQTIGVKPTQ
jgi:hypothetical protein